MVKAIHPKTIEEKLRQILRVEDNLSSTYSRRGSHCLGNSPPTASILDDINSPTLSSSPMNLSTDSLNGYKSNTMAVKVPKPNRSNKEFIQQLSHSLSNPNSTGFTKRCNNNHLKRSYNGKRSISVTTWSAL